MSKSRVNEGGSETEDSEKIIAILFPEYFFKYERSATLLHGNKTKLKRSSLALLQCKSKL